jgi:hypothetical protein
VRRGRLRRGRLCHRIWTGHRLVRGLRISLRLRHLPRLAAGSLRRFFRRRRSYLWWRGFGHHIDRNFARRSGMIRGLVNKDEREQQTSMRQHRGRGNFGKATAAIPRRGCRLRRRSGKSIAATGGKIPFLAATLRVGVRAQRLPLQIAAAWRSFGLSASRRYKPQSLSRTLANTARNISCVSTPVFVL